MNVSRTLQSDRRYLIELLQAAIDGASSARETSVLPVLGGPVWVPAAVGAVVGASTISLKRNRNPGYDLAVAGLVGSVIGLGCGVVWAARGFAGSIARGAMRKVNTVRDAHWLDRNPIDYA